MEKGRVDESRLYDYVELSRRVLATTEARRET
jgi:hypothetical protein